LSVSSERNAALDCLRGAVMILMALDHSRMFLGTSVDLHTAEPALYFTRWVTHYCAPVFVLLAGIGAYLHGQRLGSTRALERYLLTRGLWLVFLEITVVRFVWLFYLGPNLLVLQVIWAIGMSMVVLSALVWLPRGAIAVFAAALIAGHDWFDGIRAQGEWRWLWLVLHEEGTLEPFPGASWFVLYPLVPWVAVMAAGYAIGPWWLLPRDVRRRRLLRGGAALTAGFVLLRASNFYGDPHPWSAEGGALRALLSFLDCEKYPPSLLYLAMTLGPTLCALAWLDRPLGPWATRIAVYGRVPLLYYVLHVFLIHTAAIAVAWPSLGAAVFSRPPPGGELGYPLPAVYALWCAVILALYPVCAWFGAVKRRSTGAWASYL